MTDLVSNVQITLQSAGYKTWLISGDEFPTTGFEDDATLGFVLVFETAEALLQNWQQREMSLLLKHAINLRRAAEKAWNVYGIFLTAAAANQTQVRQIQQIEEDLERTRKIAAAQVQTSEDVVQALLPLMPIQYAPRLDDENVAVRLRRRLEVVAPTVVETVFGSDPIPQDIMRLLKSAQ